MVDTTRAHYVVESYQRKNRRHFETYEEAAAFMAVCRAKPSPLAYKGLWQVDEVDAAGGPGEREFVRMYARGLPQ